MKTTPLIDPAKVRECQTLGGFGRIMLACRFDPGGQLIVVGGAMPDLVQYRLFRENGSVQWSKPGQRMPMSGHKSWVCTLAFAPDGKRLFTADYAGFIHAWDFPALDPKHAPSWRKPAHEGWVRALAVSPDGRLLASCGNDGAARLWSLAEGTCLHELSGHTCHVYNLAFHPGSQRLITGDLKGHIKDWNTATGKLVREMDAKQMWVQQSNLQLGGVRSMAFHPDGQTFACGGMYGFGSIGDGIGSPCTMLFDWKSGKRLRILQAKDTSQRSFVNGIHFHPSGLILAATGGLDGGVLLFWKSGEEKAFHQHKLAQSAWSMDVHPDQTHLAIAHHDQCVRFYDLADS